MKTEYPLVSIAVISYNSAATICDTLDSALHQDYDNYEVLIFDDCSTDDTLQKIEEWKKAQPAADIERLGFTICASEKNQGVVKNCNRALEYCGGKYILFLAGDDLPFPYTLSKMTSFAEANSLPVVFSQIEAFGDKDSFLEIQRMQKIITCSYERLKLDTHEQYLLLLQGNYIAGPVGAFFNRQFFIDFGGYDERFPMIEDWPFYLKYMREDFPVKLLNKPMICYRVSGTSLSRSGSTRYWKSVYDFFQLEVRNALIQNGMVELANQREKEYQAKLQGRLGNERLRLAYDLLFQWLFLKQRSVSVSDYFKKNNIRHIAIYGMGDLALLLLQELEDSDISVDYGIDANWPGDYWDLHIFSPDDVLPQTDLIVVTPLTAYEAISRMLQKKCPFPVCSIANIIQV